MNVLIDRNGEYGDRVSSNIDSALLLSIFHSLLIIVFGHRQPRLFVLYKSQAICEFWESRFA